MKRPMPKLRELSASERERLAASVRALRDRANTPEFLAELERYISGFTAEQVARALAKSRPRYFVEEQ